MPETYQKVFAMRGVEPFYPEVGRERALAFMPNLTVLKGTVLAQVSAADANEVQTINFDAGIDGGTFTLSIVGIDGGTFTTAALAYNITNANLKIAIDALLASAGYAGATVTITNGALPTDATVTFGGTSAAWNMPLMTATSNLTDGGVAEAVTVDATTGGNKLGLWGPYVGTKLADPTTGPTATSAATGSLPLLGQYVVTYTHLTAQGESLPSPGTPVALTTTDQSIDVTPAALPAGTTGIRIYLNGVFAEESTQTTATLVNVGAIAGTASIAMPTINTAFTNTDGRQVARAIAHYDFRTDAFGRVAFADAGTTPQNSAYETTAPAWFGGEFKTTDLVGLDAQAVADLGRLQSGTIADGILAVI
jgi:hypothetical protein